MTQVPPQNPPPTPPPNPTPAPPPPPPAGGDANQLAMLAHLLGIIGFLPSLIIWQVKKDIPFVAQEAKEALNFQITVLIAYITASVISFAIPFHFILIGHLTQSVWLGNIVFCIMAAMKAKEGIAYRYPFALRLVK